MARNAAEHDLVAFPATCEKLGAASSAMARPQNQGLIESCFPWVDVEQREQATELVNGLQ